MKIHCFQTGSVRVKRAHFRLGVPDSLRYPAIIADPFFTEWLPIYVWVIEHSEGLIVVDTGETARVAEADYFACDPLTGLFFRTALRFDVPVHQEIGPLLQDAGLPPNDVRRVVLTHLHSDHAGGMHHFPRAEFFVGRAEFYGSRAGALPCRWLPQWTPRLVEYVPEAIGAFAYSYPLTRAGDVFLVPTPGHSSGHQSVLIREEQRFVLLAGDASFSLEQVLTHSVAGICDDVGQARHTLTLLKNQLYTFPTVYLPSHDPQSKVRLTENVCFPF